MQHMVFSVHLRRIAANTIEISMHLHILYYYDNEQRLFPYTAFTG
jgi:hypothetical protein